MKKGNPSASPECLIAEVGALTRNEVRNSGRGGRAEVDEEDPFAKVRVSAD